MQRFSPQLVRTLWSFHTVSAYAPSTFVQEKINAVLKSAVHTVPAASTGASSSLSPSSSALDAGLSLQDHVSLLRLAHDVRVIGPGVAQSARYVAASLLDLPPGEAAWCTAVLINLVKHTPDDLKHKLPTNFVELIAQVAKRVDDIGSRQLLSLIRTMLLSSEATWQMLDTLVIARVATLSGNDAVNLYLLLVAEVRKRGKRLLAAVENSLRLLAKRALEERIPLQSLQTMLEDSLAAGVPVMDLQAAFDARMLATDPSNAAPSQHDTPEEVVEWLRRAIAAVKQMEKGRLPRRGLASPHELDREVVLANSERPLIAKHLSRCCRTISRLPVEAVQQLILICLHASPPVDFSVIRGATLARLLSLEPSWTFVTAVRILIAMPQFIDLGGLVNNQKERVAVQRSVEASVAKELDPDVDTLALCASLASFVAERAPTCWAEVSLSTAARAAAADVRLHGETAKFAPLVVARIAEGHAKTVAELSEINLVPHLRVLALLPSDAGARLAAELINERGDALAGRLAQQSLDVRDLGAVFVVVARAPTLSPARFRMLSHCAQVLRSAGGGAGSEAWVHQLPATFAADLIAPNKVATAPVVDAAIALEAVTTSPAAASPPTSRPGIVESALAEQVERDRLRHAPTLNFAADLAVARRDRLPAADLMALLARLIALGCTAADSLNLLVMAVLQPQQTSSSAAVAATPEAVADLLYIAAQHVGRFALPPQTLANCVTRLRVAASSLSIPHLIRSLYALRRLNVEAHPSMLGAIVSRASLLITQEASANAVNPRHLVALCAELKALEPKLPPSAVAFEAILTSFCQLVLATVCTNAKGRQTFDDAAVLSVVSATAAMRCCPHFDANVYACLQTLLTGLTDPTAAKPLTESSAAQLMQLAAALGAKASRLAHPLVSDVGGPEETPAVAPAAAVSSAPPSSPPLPARSDAQTTLLLLGEVMQQRPNVVNSVSGPILVEAACALANAGYGFGGDVTETHVRVVVSHPLLLRLRATVSDWVGVPTLRKLLEEAALLHVVAMRGEAAQSPRSQGSASPPPSAPASKQQISSAIDLPTASPQPTDTAVPAAATRAKAPRKASAKAPVVASPAAVVAKKTSSSSSTPAKTSSARSKQPTVRVRVPSKSSRVATSPPKRAAVARGK